MRSPWDQPTLTPKCEGCQRLTRDLAQQRTTNYELLQEIEALKVGADKMQAKITELANR